MAIHSLFPIVQGVEYGLVSSEAKRLEDSVRAGGNHYLTAALQIWQGAKTVHFADKAIAAAGLPAFSWAQKSVVYLTPVLLAVLKKANFEKIHNYNLFINFYGDEFGLRKAAAENDDTAIVDPLVKWMISQSAQKLIQQAFWGDHDAYDQARVLIKAIGTPQLPKPEFYAFWKDWIERQQIEEFEKAALREELGNGSLFGRPVEIDGEICSAFAMLMLLDMGILEEDPDSPTTPSLNKMDGPEYRAAVV
ncbi:MAG TPA: hypothetical protein VHL30_00085 [Chlamydiales bacterium]|jgi:hypothetical protein|nr:hypothetical protein [Chlamydiales bacterium]